MPFLRISFFRVVKDFQLCQVREEFDQIGATAGVSFTDLVLRNVVPTEFHSRAHPSDVQFRTFQANVPNANFQTLRGRCFQQRGYGVSP